MAEGLRAEMNRSLAMYYSNLGTIYATKTMTDEAEAEFKHALEADGRLLIGAVAFADEAWPHGIVKLGKGVHGEEVRFGLEKRRECKDGR